MDNINLMEYWINSSEEDYNVMKYIYKGKKNRNEYSSRGR